MGDGRNRSDGGDARHVGGAFTPLAAQEVRFLVETVLEPLLAVAHGLVVLHSFSESALVVRIFNLFSLKK